MYVEESLQDRYELFRRAGKPGLAETLGIELTYITRAEIRATMPVDERTRQPAGLLHGGASVALAETVASLGTWFNIDPETYSAAGLEINANHLRPLRSGTVTATACPLSAGTRTWVWDIRITVPDGKMVCVSRCTVAVVTRRDPDRRFGT